MDFILYIIVLLVLLYFVIRIAIDNSDTAQNIQFIRNYLEGETAERAEEDAEEQYNITEIPIDKCPACLSEVTTDDKVCPSCGLYLDDE